MLGIVSAPLILDRPIYGGVVYGLSKSVSPNLSEVITALAKMPQVEMPITHHHSKDIYVRQINMPAGTAVIGHKHKTQHLNILVSGKVRLVYNGEESIVDGFRVFESGAGVQKVLEIIEDCIWLTVHANPENERDEVALEERLIEMTPEFIEAKNGRSVDEFRMSKTLKEDQLCHSPS